MEAGVNWKLVPAGAGKLVRLQLLGLALRYQDLLKTQEHMAQTKYPKTEIMRNLRSIETCSQDLEACVWIAHRCEIDVTDMIAALPRHVQDAHRRLKDAH